MDRWGGGDGRPGPGTAAAGARVVAVGGGGPGAARTVTYAFVMGLVFWAVVLFAVAIGTTFAYRFIGSKWEKKSLGYSAEPSVMAYTEAGMDLWAGIADIRPVKGGSDIEVVLKPLLPPIYYAGQPAQANVTQANGRISHCEVRLDPVHFPAMNDASRAATVIHELGHCLGLDHSDSPSIMMNPYFYAFGADDAAGAAALYGAPATATATSTAATAMATAPAPTPTAVKATPATSTPAAESQGLAAPLSLVPGWNLVTWEGAAVEAGACGCAAVYRAEGTAWRRWLVSQPKYVNSLRTLDPGVSYWMFVN